MVMMPTECIICGVKNKVGLKLNNLQGEPFFCERCLLLSFMRGMPRELDEYYGSVKVRDNSVSSLAHENIWKEGNNVV